MVIATDASTAAPGYVSLPAEGEGAEIPDVGKTSLVISSAILACLLNSGLVFGYSALYPELLKTNAFHDKCQDSTQDGKVCDEQKLALTGMFTIATSALNMSGMPIGAVLDKQGPRTTAMCMSLLLALGCVLFAFGGPGVWELNYYIGFLMMACFGPPVFVCTLSFANLFPGREGLITASLVGCFDASSSIFIGLAALMARGLASFAEAMAGYAAVPLLTALCAALCWPSSPVPSGHAVSNVAEQEEPKYGAIPFRQQLATAEYWLLVYTVCASMVCLNFFIATAEDQLAAVDSRRAMVLTQTFATMLPLGGIVYVPVIGYIIDSLKPTKGWIVLWACLIMFSVLQKLYGAFGSWQLAFASFVIFAFCRPLFYTLAAAFTAELFGSATFGKLYGLLFTIAGTANLLVRPLQSLALLSPYGFAIPNDFLLAAVSLTLALPALVSWRERLKRRTPALRHAGRSFIETPGLERRRSFIG